MLLRGSLLHLLVVLHAIEASHWLLGVHLLLWHELLGRRTEASY